MRRFLAILLLAAFGLPAVAPLLAQGQAPDSRLPICCRRNGTHHCTMGTQNTTTPTFNASCPSFPQPTAIAPQLTFAALLPSQPSIKLPITIPSRTARAETQRRLSRERTRQKRGPPAALLAA